MNIANKIFPFLLLVWFSLMSLDIHAQDAKAGKATFRSKCGSCHDVSLKSKMTGPALEGVIDRWSAIGDFQGKSGEEWLKTWILNWNDPVKAGLPYAIKMKDFDPSMMTVFTGQITDEEMANLLAYMKDPSSGSAKTDAASGAANSDVNKSSGFMGLNSSSAYSIFFIGLILVLLIALYYLGRYRNLIEKVKNNQKEDGSIDAFDLEDKPITDIFKKHSFKKSLLFLAILALVFVIGRNAINLGRQQGYQPKQPIKYSHELHAGKNKIDCQYCHYTAADGKHSNIPSVSTCMNCHKAVKSGPKYGESEIAKIYEAVGWDPESKTYSKPQKPVEWVRIHNLPDHVYFNHAQHVNAGKVECQTCHGPIEEMEEVYQYAPLSMGWCINCHRNYEVNFVENSYYKTYASYHEEMKKGNRTKVTVQDIGGAECQKCHY
jgi:cytochrome c2